MSADEPSYVATDLELPRARKAWAPNADAETAAVLRLLAVRPWLIGGRDDHAIATVRRNLSAVTEAVHRLGWVLVVERDLVRLRKSPPPDGRHGPRRGRDRRSARGSS